MKVLVIVGLLVGVSGCATTGAMTPLGSAMVSVYEDSGGVGTPTKQQKHGKACSYNILGIVAAGDSSIKAAKARGGIKVVSHFDKSVFNLLTFFGKVCTVVYGG